MLKISIVIPLYNKAEYIQRAISSVLVQTYQGFELIVVDDGSTDGGGEVVRQMTDPRLRLIVQKNAGVSGARNRGIQEAACELVAFLDADDEWLPNFLATVMGLRARCPEAGMYATAYRFCKGGKTWRPNYVHCVIDSQGGLLEDYFRAALGPLPVCSSAVMIPKHVFAEVGAFPAGMKRGEDLHTWTKIALRYRVAWSPVVSAIYHLSADNRACNIALVPDNVATVLPIEEFLQSGCVPVSSRSMAEEYLVSWQLKRVLGLHLSGKKSYAWALLEKTRDTKIFRNKRLLLVCLVRIPRPMLKFMRKIKFLIYRMIACK